MEDPRNRPDVEALRALARRREEQSAAEQSAKEAAGERFRADVRRFAQSAAERLWAAGVPTSEARLARPDSESEPEGRRSWQKPPSLRERMSRFKQSLNAPAAPPREQGPGAVRGWHVPIIHPLTGQRSDHGQLFTVYDVSYGESVESDRGSLIVFCTAQGRLFFAARTSSDVYLYPFRRDVTWVDRFAGADISALAPREVVLALGFFRSGAPAWEVGRDQSLVELYEASDHNDTVAGALVTGWHAALEDLLESHASGGG